MALHPGYDTATETIKAKNEEEEAKEMAAASGVEITEVKELSKAVKKIYKNVRNLMVESKMSMVRQNAHNESV